MKSRSRSIAPYQPLASIPYSLFLGLLFAYNWGTILVRATGVKMRGALLWMVWLGVASGLAGCGGGGGGGTRSGGDGWANLSPPIYSVEEAEQRAKWTVLVYLDADNDLESAGIHNFNQMEVVGSTQDVHVIVQMDRRSGTDPNNEDWTDTRRYLITRDSDPIVMHSVRLDDPPLGELNMASGTTLRNFVAWGKHEFPADHYLLIIWDHGSGWQMRTTELAPAYKYIAVDDTSGAEMNIPSIPIALTGLRMDVIAFDACYMQQLEVAYELRGCADYMVGSSAAEPSPGYNYSRLLSRISGDDDAEQLATVIVQQYAAEYPEPEENITQSAVDLGAIGNVATAASGFAGVLCSNASTWPAELAEARSESLDYASMGTRRYSLDLLDYAARCAAVIGPAANAAYTQVQASLSAAVVASVHNSDMPNAHGLAIYVPPPADYDNSYEQLSLAHNTLWDEWLQDQQE
jgi:hypothetical protein